MPANSPFPPPHPLGAGEKDCGNKGKTFYWGRLAFTYSGISNFEDCSYCAGINTYSLGIYFFKAFCNFLISMMYLRPVVYLRLFYTPKMPKFASAWTCASPIWTVYSPLSCPSMINEPLIQWVNHKKVGVLLLHLVFYLVTKLEIKILKKKKKTSRTCN